MSQLPTVWIVNQYAIRPGMPGGGRHYKFAAQLDAMGHRTLVVHAENGRDISERTNFRAGTTEIVGGIAFHAVKNRAYRGNGLDRLRSTMGFAIRLLASPPKGRPDVILGSSPDLLSAFSSWLLARRLGVPFVLEVRDVWPASLVEVAGVSPRHPYVRLLGRLEKLLYEKSSAIVGLLPMLSERVREVAGASHVEKVSWVPNASIALEEPVEKDSDPSEPHGPPGDTNDDASAPLITVVYAGAQGPPNALSQVVRAAKVLQDVPRSDGIRLKFCLYGDGVLREELQSEANAAGLVNVSFPGVIPKNEIIDVLRAADIGVLPGLATGLYRYGVSPNKLYDYLGVGLPVVTSLASPRNPVVLSGAGIAVDPADDEAFAAAILTLARLSERERRTIGKRGVAYVRDNNSIVALSIRLSRILCEVIEKA